MSYYDILGRGTFLEGAYTTKKSSFVGCQKQNVHSYEFAARHVYTQKRYE